MAPIIAQPLPFFKGNSRNFGNSRKNGNSTHPKGAPRVYNTPMTRLLETLAPRLRPGGDDAYKAETLRLLMLWSAERRTARANAHADCRAKNPSTCRVHGTHPGAVGKSGDWKSLGLKPGREIKGDKPVEQISQGEAIAKMKAGDTVKNPLGETLRIDEYTYKHINKKGRNQKEASMRLREYQQMKDAVSHPHEIWMDEKSKRRKYVQFLELNGKMVINAVDEYNNHILSWHSNSTTYDYYRVGKLIYLRKG